MFDYLLLCIAHNYLTPHTFSFYLDDNKYHEVFFEYIKDEGWVCYMTDDMIDDPAYQLPVFPTLTEAIKDFQNWWDK